MGVKPMQPAAAVRTAVSDLHNLLVQVHAQRDLAQPRFLILFLRAFFSSVYSYNNHPFFISFR